MSEPLLDRAGRPPRERFNFPVEEADGLIAILDDELDPRSPSEAG